MSEHDWNAGECRCCGVSKTVVDSGHASARCGKAADFHDTRSADANGPWVVASGLNGGPAISITDDHGSPVDPVVMDGRSKTLADWMHRAFMAKEPDIGALNLSAWKYTPQPKFDPDPRIEWSTVNDPTTWDVQQPPERQHVSDAAWEAFTRSYGYGSREKVEEFRRNEGTVLLTVAEHDELLALRAEVERLRAMVALKDVHIAGHVRHLRDVDAMIEQLRKGRDDYVPTQQQIDSLREKVGPQESRQWHGGLLVSPIADHRLGLGLPDAEPCDTAPRTGLPRMLP